jgi:hypothetical protein
MSGLRFSTRLLSGVFTLAAYMFAGQAEAMIGAPAPVPIDGGPLGPMEINVGVDGLGYVTSNTPQGIKSDGAQLDTALVNASTTTGILRGDVEVGEYSGLILGYPAGTATPGGQNYTPFSPLFDGYISIVPNDHIEVSAGQFGTPEGFESGQDWNNYSIFHTMIAYVEPGQSRGVNTNFSYGPVHGVVQFDDGYYSRLFNYLQWLVTYTVCPSLSVTLNGGSHLSVSGPHLSGIGNLLYNNSSLYGGWVTYMAGNFTVTPEVQYVYTSKLNNYAPEENISKTAANFTSAVFADYGFGTSPYSLGGFVEYASETSARADGGTGDFFGYGPGTTLWGAALTPTWQYKTLFARTDLAFSHVNATDGAGVKAQFAGVLEVGLLY